MLVSTSSEQQRTSSRAFFTDFDSFDSAISSSFVPLLVSGPPAARFRGRLCAADAHHITFAEVSANAHDVYRNESLIEQGGGDYFKLSLMQAGTGLLVQDNREVILSPGDVAIYDTARPYTLTFDRDFCNLVVMIPKSSIDLPAELVAELTATHLSRDTALGTIVSQTLPQMPGALVQSPDLVRRQLAQTTTDLISTLITATLGSERLDQDPRQVLIRSVREYIRDHLQSPTLGPEEVAAAHYLSPRRLHGIFQGEGETIAAMIRSLRLERCYADLQNPAYADRPVSAIAAQWCFLDAAHFSRTFRARFGISPSELRLSR
ncbi:helix-turn-helix domain-containing protein [Leucobacter insecticola]|uniref:Helix-turn-helix domain-containing protein n=1 Tax=Leucobacter insecticola TaxID=2714934 RepID=A0A6G8FIV6_9MICO|nr:helix-turn-helix domain-containing protein [Leucobacter insecticola]QIM16268.1 helix-turn-helix domain-containing protein [Leucobacter insecticola]